MTHHLEATDSERTITVELANRGDRIAFFIELLLTDGQTGEPIVPIFWQDNYVTLLPDETRTVSTAFSGPTCMPILTVRGWNAVQAGSASG